MNYKYNLSAAVIGVSIALVQPQVTRATCSYNQVDAIGEKITVLIDSKEPGSGVIIKQEGNTYTVLTAYHVVRNSSFKYKIVTPDGRHYQLNYQMVKRLSNNIDLAVLQFTSSQSYQVAKLGNSDEVQRGTNVYLAGFPAQTGGVRVSVYDCRNGAVIANATQISVDGGYTLFYENSTLPGMNGGAVLNDKGEVIGINGRGEGSSDVNIDQINPSVATIKSGRNSGIPINTFIRLSRGLLDAPNGTKLKADDFYVQASEKYNKRDFQGAIAVLTEAISVNSNDAEAYLGRGFVRFHLGDQQAALEDFKQAIKINPNSVAAYVSRGTVRYDLGDKQAALDDFHQAIKINPNYAVAYHNRGKTHYELGDKQAAIEDFNQAIKINPNFVEAYSGRGVVRYDLGDKQVALDDFNQVIKINPNYVWAYLNRGNARSALGDKQAALEDYNQAIKINPNYAFAFIGRGIVRYELGDKQAAITDYNQAIKINPNYAEAYYRLGVVRYELGDKQGAIAGIQQAVDLYKEQGNKEWYQKGLELLKLLQQ